jgi:hypothetical protein
VWASRPAAGTPLSVTQVQATPINALLPGLELFGGLDPADPFVAGKRRYVLPRRQRLRVGNEGVPKIVGKVVHDPSRDVCRLDHPEHLNARPN